MKKIIILSFLVLALTFSLPGWDDEELFYNSVKPNILFLLDSSGSMRNAIYHPDYEPGTGTGTCANAPDGMYSDWPETKYLARWSNGSDAYTSSIPDATTYQAGCHERYFDGSHYRYRVDSGGAPFQVGDTTILYSPENDESEGWAEIIDIQEVSGNRWITLDNVHGGELDANQNELGRFVPAGWNDMRFVVCRNNDYSPRLVKFWGGIDQEDSTRTASYRFNGTNEIDDYFEWVFNNASDTHREQISHFADHGTFDTTDSTVHQNTYTRIQVAREALKGITDHPKFNDKVRIGLMEFNGAHGGYLAYHDGHYGLIKDIEDGSNKADLLDIVEHMRADGSTPLGEALAETWNYFAGNEPYYSSRTGGTGSSYDSPCDLYCRKNFVVVISDGQPNADNNFFSIPEGGEIDDFYDTEPSGWSGPDWNTADVAKYLFNHDARTDLQETQNIFVHTIGFTTSGETNELLTHAALNGGGEFFQANDYNSLVDQFAEILGKIMEKVTSFSAFAAPKHSLTHGQRGYIATFIPRTNKARWEGFMKAYVLDDEGDFEVDANGDVMNPLWDAEDMLGARTYNGGPGSFGTGAGSGDRTLFTWLGEFGGRQQFYDSNSNITADMLNIDPTDPDAAQYRSQIIEVVRGKENPYDYDSYLGDVFHFDPKVCSPPWEIQKLFNPSFSDFYDTHKNRDEVLVVGANDGMLHCFRAEDGHELWGFIPPSSLASLDKIGMNYDHDYFVDGQAVIQDVQVDDAGSDSDWESVLVFGQGMGGESYYGLDLTDVTDPRVKWEIGNENMDNGNLGKTVAKTSSYTTVLDNDSRFGRSMSKAAIGAIKYRPSGSEPQYVAVIPGGYDTSELTPLSIGGNLMGKALYIVDIDTGDIIKRFEYSDSSGNSDTRWTSSDFLYSMTASPTMVDFDNDAYYDCIYQADIGGRIWKIDISSQDRDDWIPQIIFDTDATISEGISSQPFFVAPTVGYGSEYNVWIFAGTGYRSQPNDQSAIGHFYLFKDEFESGDPAFTPADLEDITAPLITKSSTLDTDGDGYSDTFEQSQGTDPDDPNDFPAGEEPDNRITVSDPDGFYFQFINGDSGYKGEKLFDPAPLYIGGTIIFNTYLPPDGDGGTSNEEETCDPAGDLYVYRMDFSVIGGTISLDSPDVSKGRILGSGLLSGDEYKVYIGEGEIGSSSIEKQESIPLAQTLEPLFWKEVKPRIYK